MDEINKAILQCLNKNGRSSVSEISKQVNLSVPAVAERIRRMESQGIIQGYTVKIDRESIQQDLTVFLLVTLDNVASIAPFRQAMENHNDVLECHHLAGHADYLLKATFKNTRQLEHFITDELKKLDGVASTNTLIVLSTIKESVNKDVL